MNFQTGKRYKTIRHCWFLHTPYKRIGYVIIPKPHFQGVVVAVLTCCFRRVAQSVGAMTIKRSCVLAGHGRPITSESSVTPLFIQQTIQRRSAFAIVYGCFSRIKKMLGRTETRTRERKYLGRIRSVWDISRGDRARIATCSLRTLTDRLKTNYSIDYGLFLVCVARIDGLTSTLTCIPILLLPYFSLLRTK